VPSAGQIAAPVNRAATTLFQHGAMRFLLLLPALLALPGCLALTPYEACFAAQTRDYRALWHATREAGADLMQGYRLIPVEIPAARATLCRDGGVSRDCLINGSASVGIPVAIDAETAEARYLALRSRLDAERPGAMARVELACGPRPD